MKPMKKSLAIIAFLLLVQSSAFAESRTGSFRIWTYQNFTLVLNRYISWSVIPGWRVEMYNTRASADGMYFIELFTGPVFNSKEMKTGQMITKFVIPVWYYYNGYPFKDDGIHVSTHNIAIAPMMINRFGSVIVMNRLFFHNTLYADMYGRMMDYSSRLNSGFSCLLAWKIEIGIPVDGPWKINIANELFAGIAENRKVPAMTGPGFSDKGVQFDRIYAGFTYTYSDENSNAISINPQYVLELNCIGEGVRLRGIYHYVYLVMSYSFNLVRDEKRRTVNDGHEDEKAAPTESFNVTEPE